MLNEASRYSAAQVWGFMALTLMIILPLVLAGIGVRIVQAHRKGIRKGRAAYEGDCIADGCRHRHGPEFPEPPARDHVEEHASPRLTAPLPDTQVIPVITGVLKKFVPHGRDDDTIVTGTEATLKEKTATAGCPMWCDHDCPKGERHCAELHLHPSQREHDPAACPATPEPRQITPPPHLLADDWLEKTLAKSRAHFQDIADGKYHHV